MYELSKRYFIKVLFFALPLFLIPNFYSHSETLSSPDSATNALALTPPMGWNSWNTFTGGVSDVLIRQVADAMVTNGMKNAGYQYVIIDDGWSLPNRLNGHLQPNPKTFPNGIKILADYVHAKGLKFGIYACRGRLTCMEKGAGSYGYETIDAKDFADWGVDYLKYDNCNPGFLANQEKDYQHMQTALADSGRPIVFSVCAWEFKPWMPSIGNLWRTSGDITNNWDAMLAISDVNEQSALEAGPGRWNDPDALVAGCGEIRDNQHGTAFDGASELVGAGEMTADEWRAQFSLWAIMAAPLIASNDVRSMSLKVREILLNREVIAVDQDVLGRQGLKVWDSGTGLNIYSKRLNGGHGWAVLLLNRSTVGAVITAPWKDIGVPVGPATVRDLWAHANRGTFSDSYKAYVPSHGGVMLKISSFSNSL
jgi:alpha-galactosidase